MGLQESKPVERKLSKSKSSSTQKPFKGEQLEQFVQQISTLSCLRSTNSQKLEFSAFQKLPFISHYSDWPRCTNISNQGSSVFVCYDCSIDDHAYLCQPCFEKGNHEKHRFSIFPNNNGWRVLFCRCGDEDFMKKKTICETHKQAPKLVNTAIDKQEAKKFHAYFSEALKVLQSLADKGRNQALLDSILNSFQKYTTNNLFYSKVLCQFLLAKSTINSDKTNFYQFRQGLCFNASRYSILRNLNVASEYKEPLLRQMLATEYQSRDFSEFIVNFSGKITHLNFLSKNQNLVLNSSSYFQAIIKSEQDAIDIWKGLIDNKQIKEYILNRNIIMAIFDAVKTDEKHVIMLLEQLLDCSYPQSSQYVIACMMVLSPDYFLSSSKKSKSKSKALDKLEKKILQYYTSPLIDLSTHSLNQNVYAQILLLLPFFSFGKSIINKFWDEVEMRVDIISSNKQRAVIKQASMNALEIVNQLLTKFMTWEHLVITRANTFSLIEYTKDHKFIEKILMELFDKNPKIFRLDMLRYLDTYTQKQRHLAADVIKKYLRYNTRKGKYYNISKKMNNNPFNYEELNVGFPLKLSDWQQHVASDFFTDSFYRMIPKLIKFAQKSVMQDMQMVKTVSDITTALSLINKKQKNNLKDITRNFIKQIPDVKQHTYYILAKIRDRLELDIDQIEEKGKKGSKKVKLDLITEIRDKKFRQMKEKQQRVRKRWLMLAEKAQSDHEAGDVEEDICHICKQQQDEKRRFVFPCNFTRNNIVSTLLKSEVTDLDINICLHKIHEDCYNSQKRKNQCEICKFQINCFIPTKPTSEESFTKPWLRTFENIVTRINLDSGKSFNSDWATIFLTYLIYSKSFKVLLKSSQIQQKQKNVADDLILTHYRNQLEKYPELTKQSIKKAEKTVKGQITRESNTKKVVKSLILELVLQQITGQPVKNVKRVQKKFREMINMIGTQNSSKIREDFPWARDHEAIQQVYDSNVSEQVGQLFKIRKLPEKASQYLKQTSIKCPMCNKFQPTTWECLFCEKVSCANCMNTRFHCERDHRGSGIILHVHDATYELTHENRQVQSDSLYRNQYSEGWRRNVNPEGWQAHTNEIYTFFDNILHSLNPVKRVDPADDYSDDGRLNNNVTNLFIDDEDKEQQDQQDEGMNEYEDYQ